MKPSFRPIPFWMIIVFLSLTAVLLALGQAMAVFNYELAVQLGLQEDGKLIGEYGVQVNRAFGVGDTVVYLPLAILSIIGLFLRQRWALATTAAVMGISCYWPVTIIFMLLFLQGVPTFNFMTPMDYWIILSSYIVFSLWALWYLAFHGERLLGK